MRCWKGGFKLFTVLKVSDIDKNDSVERASGGAILPQLEITRGGYSSKNMCARYQVVDKRGGHKTR